MSHSTLKKLALWGALSLGAMSQTAYAQWMPFGGGGCGCAIPQVPASICGPTCGVACAPPQPQYVMQPFTETRTIEQVVQRPVYETKYVEVPQTEYRQHVETHVANVPTCSYQNVTEMQTRQRDCGRWVTNYRCRQFVAPCAYDNRPGLFGMMNRALYSARMSVTPAVVAERSYVPNVITEQIPVTRQVAVPGVRQVSYQVPKTVAIQTTRKVAVHNVRYVAEKIPQQVQVTTMRMVQVGGTGMAYGLTPGVGTAGLPGYNSVATPDPIGGGLRTATRPDPLTPAPIPAKTRPRTAITGEDADQITPPTPNVPKSTRNVIPPRDMSADEVVEEVAQNETPVRRTAGYRGASAPVQAVTSAPSIVRVSQWNRRPSFTEKTSDVSVASSKTGNK